MNDLRRPTDVLHSYQCLKILEVESNNLFSRTYLINFSNSVAVLMSVICNFFLVRFSGDASILLVLVMILVSGLGATYLILLHIVFGGYNEVCKKSISSWKRNTSLNSYEKRSINSCRSLRVESGQFGYFQKHTTLNIVGRLVYLTVRVLMLTKNY